MRFHLRHPPWLLLTLLFFSCGPWDALAQLHVTLYSDAACLTALPSSSLLFNSTYAWLTLSPPQVVPFNLSGTSLRSQRCQSTVALQAVGVGDGIYMCRLPNRTIENGTSTVYAGALYVLEWSTADASGCPSNATTLIDQSLFVSFLNVDQCTPSTLSVSDIDRRVYALIHGCTVGGPARSSSQASAGLSTLFPYILGLTSVWLMVHNR